jgi:hypothetical protein
MDSPPGPDGCRDVDLEASPCTNTIPIHRLGLEAGDSADAPAAYVRWLDLSVQRLEQEYHLLDEQEVTSPRLPCSPVRLRRQARVRSVGSGALIPEHRVASRAIHGGS